MHIPRRRLTRSVRPPTAVGLVAVFALAVLLVGFAPATSAHGAPADTASADVSDTPTSTPDPHAGDDAGGSASQDDGQSGLPPSTDTGQTPSDPATGTPSPPPTPEPLEIASPQADGLVSARRATVQGTGNPGDTVTVTATPPDSGATHSCTTETIPQSGAWSCAVQGLHSGPGWVLTARSADGGKSAPVTFDVLTAPVITPSDATTSGIVTGSGAVPDATVAVTSPSAPDDDTCEVKADRHGDWICSFGPDHSHPGAGPAPAQVSATQTITWHDHKRVSQASTARLIFDRSAPPAPVLSTPRTGTRITTGEDIRFSGTGAACAQKGYCPIVQIRVGTSQIAAMLCAAPVHDGHWSCTGGAYLKHGSYDIVAVQMDAVGNVSTGSRTLALTVAPAPTHTPKTHQHDRSEGHPNTPKDPAPTRPKTHTPAPTPTAPPTPSTGAGPDWPSENLIGNTPITETSAPSLALTAFPGWVRALLLAATALLLLAVPVRLLASSFAGSASERAGTRRLFGRNQGSTVSSTPLTASSTTTAVSVGVVIATATLTALAAPTGSVAAYLQLLLAALLAVCVVNGVWVLVGHTLARRASGTTATVRVTPWMLVLVSASVLLSRVADLQPGFIFALVFTVALADSAPRAAQGRLAAAQVGAVTALGAVAWALTAVLPGITSVPELAGDLLNAIAIVAIGSAALSLLPVGRMPGRAVLAWSRWVWLGLSLAVGTILFALLVPVDSVWSSGAGGLLLLAFGVGFALVSLALWLWSRYIEPRM